MLSFIFNKKKEIAFAVIFLIMFSIYAWIMATPEGAIRRRLLLSDGLYSAVTAEIELVEKKHQLRSWDYTTYQVSIDGVDEKWRLWAGLYSCYGRPLND